MTVLAPFNAKIASEAKPLDYPLIRRVTETDLSLLQEQLLATSRREDTYSQSASYYAMTGRNGLWVYGTEDTFMMIAAHPNREDHLLLFPPMGREPASLLKQFVFDRRISANHIQLARMSAQDHLLLTWAQASGQFNIQPENLLDWAYPAHMLSTDALIKRVGKAFRDFRKGVLRAERNGLSARMIDLPKDKPAIKKLIDSWAETSDQERYSKGDLTAPARTILSLMENTDLPLYGLVVHKKDQPVGFITWEETDPENGIANSMGNVSVDGRGVSEFMYLSMAETLSNRGFGSVYIGGSETEGLENFKRKMNPINSVALRSAFAPRP